MSISITESYPSLTGCEYLLKLSYSDFSNYFNHKKDCKQIYQSMLKMCNEIIKSNGSITRIYNYSLNSNRGRLFSGGSIQCVPKEIRGFLAKHTTDIDMKNAHPTILLYICKKYNISAPQLEYYVNHRDEIFLKSADKELIKQLYLKATNKDELVKEVLEYSKEILKIQKVLLLENDFKDILLTVEGKKWNKNGSFLNKILCIYEDMIVRTAIDSLKNYKEQVGELFSIMFDGFMIIGNYNKDLELIEHIRKIVEEKFKGLNMLWNYKDHSNIITENCISVTKTMYEELSEDFNKTHCKIINKGFFIKKFENKNLIISRSMLMNAYENMECGVTKKNNTEYFINKWLKDPMMNTKEDVGIYPNNNVCPENIYNLWTPFAMELITELSETIENLKGKDMLLNHIKILCNNDEKIYNYFIKWLAHCITP